MTERTSAPPARPEPGDRLGRGPTCASRRSARPTARSSAVDWRSTSRSAAASSSRCSGPRAPARPPACGMIAGFERPDAGTVELGGEDVTGCRPTSATSTPSSRTTRCFRTCRVGQNVEYGLKVKKRRRRRARASASREALALVRLEGFERAPPEPALRRPAPARRARARARQPPARAAARRAARRARPEAPPAASGRAEADPEEVGITFIYVTHDQDEALSMSDRIAVMDNGRVLQVGAPHEVYDEPRSDFVAGFVGVATCSSSRSSRVADGDRPICGSAPGDECPGRRARAVRAGATALVTIRPERIAIVGGGAEPAPRARTAMPPGRCARASMPARRRASSSSSTEAAS